WRMLRRARGVTGPMARIRRLRLSNGEGRRSPCLDGPFYAERPAVRPVPAPSPRRSRPSLGLRRRGTDPRGEVLVEHRGVSELAELRGVPVKPEVDGPVG